MAEETQTQKRLREESHDAETPNSDVSSDPNTKRQKTYTNILSLLDEDDEQQQQQSHDLSAMLTTLQQELSTTFDFDSPPPCTAEEVVQNTTTDQPSTYEEDDGVQSVIRHLLEASDDELGIPNTENNCNSVEVNSDENFHFVFGENGLWEFEDVAANYYYTVLQSELFM